MSEGKVVKHYNSAYVWGRLAEVPTAKKSREGKGAPYLRLKINCYNPEFGNVQAYGNLWGKKGIDFCLAEYAKDPNRMFKFSGFFSQAPEDGETQRYTNFTFIGCETVDKAHPRASFILVGKVAKVDGDKLWIHLDREMKALREGSEPKRVAEDFELLILDRSKKVFEGDTIEAKGKLRAAEGEDEYGGNTTPIRPYIERIEVRAGAFV